MLARTVFFFSNEELFSLIWATKSLTVALSQSINYCACSYDCVCGMSVISDFWIFIALVNLFELFTTIYVTGS